MYINSCIQWSYDLKVKRLSNTYYLLHCCLILDWIYYIDVIIKGWIKKLLDVLICKINEGYNLISETI